MACSISRSIRPPPFTFLKTHLRFPLRARAAGCACPLVRLDESPPKKIWSPEEGHDEDVIDEKHAATSEEPESTADCWYDGGSRL